MCTCVGEGERGEGGGGGGDREGEGKRKGRRRARERGGYRGIEVWESKWGGGKEWEGVRRAYERGRGGETVVACIFRGLHKKGLAVIAVFMYVFPIGL